MTEQLTSVSSWQSALLCAVERLCAEDFVFSDQHPSLMFRGYGEKRRCSRLLSIVLALPSVIDSLFFTRMAVPVLIIDDNEDDLFFTSLVLERCGGAYDPKQFESAEKALDWLSSSPQPQSQIILLDINMPGMDGFDFLNGFEALPASVKSGVAIVMLTSSEDRGDRKRAEQFSSVRGYLTKPLERQAAAGLVNLLGQHEEPRES